MILFFIARLIYTFPHDTMEYDKYYLQSEDFIRKDRKNQFRLKYFINGIKKFIIIIITFLKIFIIISIKKSFL